MSNNESQRVNIQFSIELDELPTEAHRLLNKSFTHLNKSKEIYGDIDCTDFDLSSDTWNKIDSIRVCLARTDQVLDDLQNIIGGYLEMQTNAIKPQEVKSSPSSEAPAVPNPFADVHPDASPHTRPPDMASMKEHMQQIMSQMEKKMGENGLSEQEQTAAEALKNKMAAFTGAPDENTNKTSG